MHQVLETQRARARKLVAEHRAAILTLRDLLLEKKVLDREAFAPIAEATRSKPAGRKTKEAQSGQ